MPRKKGSGKAGSAEIGVVARIVDRAFDNPAAAGGLFVMTLTVAAVVGNALFLQPGNAVGSSLTSGGTRAEAPVPAGARDDLTAIISNAVPIPRSRSGADEDLAALPPPDSTTTATVAPPVVSPPPAVEAPQVQPALDPARQQLVEIQRALARLGIYSGAIDGLSGPRTRAAIVEYQAAAGLEVTGDPSAALLELMQAPAAAPPAVSAPQATTGTAEARADLARLEQESAALLERERTADVQAALNKIGYGPLQVDGEAGPDTQNAISQFESDHGLDVTGRPGDPVLRRLVDIGALDTAG